MIFLNKLKQLFTNQIIINYININELRKNLKIKDRVSLMRIENVKYLNASNERMKNIFFL